MITEKIREKCRARAEELQFFILSMFLTVFATPLAHKTRSFISYFIKTWVCQGSSRPSDIFSVRVHALVEPLSSSFDSVAVSESSSSAVSWLFTGASQGAKGRLALLPPCEAQH